MHEIKNKEKAIELLKVLIEKKVIINIDSFGGEDTLVYLESVFAHEELSRSLITQAQETLLEMGLLEKKRPLASIIQKPSLFALDIARRLETNYYCLSSTILNQEKEEYLAHFEEKEIVLVIDVLKNEETISREIERLKEYDFTVKGVLIIFSYPKITEVTDVPVGVLFNRGLLLQARGLEEYSKNVKG